MSPLADPNPDPTTGKPTRRRHWIPISLRIFLVCLGILTSVATWKGACIYREQAAIREIERLGGRVSTMRADANRPPLAMSDEVKLIVGIAYGASI